MTIIGTGTRAFCCESRLEHLQFSGKEVLLTVLPLQHRGNKHHSRVQFYAGLCRIFHPQAFLFTGIPKPASTHGGEVGLVKAIHDQDTKPRRGRSRLGYGLAESTSRV
jgi:hypothetical protein